MSICRNCGEEIEFYTENGQRTPRHVNGGRCSGSGSEYRYASNSMSDRSTSYDDFCSPSSCPECGTDVFFIRHNGGSFWVDELGWPWPKHACMDNTNVPSWYKFIAKNLPIEKNQNYFNGVVIKSKWQPSADKTPSRIILAIDGGNLGRVILATEGTTKADYLFGRFMIVDFEENRVISSSHHIKPILETGINPAVVGLPEGWATII